LKKEGKYLLHKKKKETWILICLSLLKTPMQFGSDMFGLSIQPYLEMLEVSNLNILKRKIFKGEMLDLWETKKVSNLHLN
jgi:hypothetical protein